jgi:hypothetical protein
LAHAPEEFQKGITTVARVGGAALRVVDIDAAGAIGQGMPMTHILGETSSRAQPRGTRSFAFFETDNATCELRV